MFITNFKIKTSKKVYKVPKIMFMLFNLIIVEFTNFKANNTRLVMLHPNFLCQRKKIMALKLSFKNYKLILAY